MGWSRVDVANTDRSGSDISERQHCKFYFQKTISKFGIIEPCHEDVLEADI